VREYLLVLLVAAAVTYLLTPVARTFALRLGAMTEVRDRDVHDTPTPRLGGLAMYAGIVAAFLVARSLPALQGVFAYSDVQAVVVAGGVLVLVGFVDDVWGLDALSKLAGQVVAAASWSCSACRCSPCRCPSSGRRRWARRACRSPCCWRCPPSTPSTSWTASTGWPRRRGDRGAGVLRLLLRAVQRRVTEGVAQAHQLADAHRGRAGRRLPGLPAAQLQPGSDLHGRHGAMLVGSCWSAAVVSLTGQYDYAGCRPSRLPVLLPLLLPVAVLAVHRRPAARGRAPHPGRAARRSRPTRPTCTTGCSRSATATDARS
jgi:UDP-GlcNAc:undecaprenyl-phosphate GlcNAc-1-phosphate transferase